MPSVVDESTRRYPLRVGVWNEIPGLVHGFLGRAHGLPAGDFTLDDVHDALVRAGEEPRLIAAARQVHGATVLAPEDMRAFLSDSSNISGDELPTGDAWVSASTDLILTIRTADCVPILLVAPRARAIAAVHAGWRGALDGVIGASIAALLSRYGARPNEVSAAIGPAIGGCCYTFGAEHRGAFIDRFGPAAANAWHEHVGDQPRSHLELRAICRLALEGAGVAATAITQLGPCTAECPDELHSFRRDGTHAGRQLSYIGWTS